MFSHLYFMLDGQTNNKQIKIQMSLGTDYRENFSLALIPASFPPSPSPSVIFLASVPSRKFPQVRSDR